MPVVTSLADALQAIVGPGRLLSGAGLADYCLGGTTPRAVVFPEDASEVSRVLRLAWEESLGVVPWGGGSHQSVGYRPSRYDLALDLRRLNQVLEYEPADMTATAQAGIRLVDLQRRLEAGRQFLPLDPPLADQASLGGVLAANLSGPLRCRYGTARDLTLGIRVAHADGTITKGGAKVVKNVTGYDITKLYLGSHGTLGVILEATFRVYPRPLLEQGWWLSTPKLEAAQALAIRILGSHLAPNRVELLDGPAGQACGSPVRSPALHVSIAGVPEAIRAQAVDLARIAGEFGTAPTEDAAAPRTWAGLSDFPWLNVERNGKGHGAIWRGGVLPSDCARGMRAIHEASSEWADTAMAASVAHGIVRGTFRAETPEALARSLAASREALAALGGFLVVLDAPAPVRAQVDVWGPPPEALRVMQRLKAAFDAKGILNPGRFVAGI
jgi:glycolate oxidase FAD binding subunit